MSDDFLINYALGGLVAPGLLLISVAWLFIRTGHHLIWPVLLILGYLAIWTSTALVLPSLLVDQKVSHETFLLLQQLMGIILPSLVALIAFKPWPKRNSLAMGKE